MYTDGNLVFNGSVGVPKNSENFVQENSGSFLLCVAVETEGQIEILGFSIVLEVTNGSAGLYAIQCVLLRSLFPADVSSDYTIDPLTLQYPTELCTAITIIDDQALEEVNEDFAVDVVGTSIVGSGQVLELPQSHVVIIQDNEGNYVHL